jgi:ABC-2 type transport system ATP-binding protein
MMLELNADTVLIVTDLAKVYGGKTPIRAVDGISFALARGEILGLLGPNGAGKTTTIQMLLSTLTPTSGRIAYFGRSLAENRDAILARVGYASAYSKLPTHLSIEENLDVFGRLYGLGHAERKSRVREMLSQFGIWDLRKRVMAGLSAGQTTRVMLAKAFLARPRIALLDEPTASLDPEIAHEVRDFVRRQRDGEGVSILYTSHNMDEVAEICDRVLFLDGGRIADVGRPEDLAASVAATRIRIRVDRGLDALLLTAGEWKLPVRRGDDPADVEIEIEEKRVSGFLAELASSGVRYSDIALRKPTLEDYFLKLARRRSMYPAESNCDPTVGVRQSGHGGSEKDAPR